MATIEVLPLTTPQWPALDPFLFAVHHDDAYPAGNDQLGPAASLAGRELGMDFAGKDGWRMYHGREVPGFPQHPHRGFETVTIVRRGLIDHSDSLGAAARFGGGDVQWLTAGRGISHAEMFPLVNRTSASPRDAARPGEAGPCGPESANPVELFQIWLNLPRADKLVAPHFTMLWDHAIPRLRAPGVEVTVVAGALGELVPGAPPPHSWAARPEHGVAIWTIRLEPGARWTLPAALGTNRVLYFFAGDRIQAGDRTVTQHAALLLDGDPLAIAAGDAPAELLLLGGRPIAEPVVQYGPFVMTSRSEIHQAVTDYQHTQFGGWPWPSDAPVHGDEDRFARHADGRVERPPTGP